MNICFDWCRCNKWKCYLWMFFVLMLVLLFSVPVSAAPVSEHGALSVSGSSLVDANGSAVQLKGVSTHGIAWFPEYIN